MKWEYPVYNVVEKKTDGSVAKRAKRALTREEAVRYISGDDPRPLLVLRECKVCNGTDDALLKGDGNETTFLLARWFHCVKLPVDVMEEDHPFHNMFTEKQPEHLFVCSPNGDNHAALQSETSRSELWKSMREMLAKEYAEKSKPALKAITKLLDKMDMADARVNQLKLTQEEILVKDGPDSRKLPKLAKKIAKAELAQQKLHDEFAKASVLELRRKAPAPKKEAAGAKATK